MRILILLLLLLKGVNAYADVQLSSVLNEDEFFQAEIAECRSHNIEVETCRISRCVDSTPLSKVSRFIKGKTSDETRCIYQELLYGYGGMECFVPLSQLTEFNTYLQNQYNLVFSKINGSVIDKYCIAKYVNRSGGFISLSSSIDVKKFVKNDAYDGGYNLNLGSIDGARNADLTKSLMLTPEAFQSLWGNRKSIVLEKVLIKLDYLSYSNENSWSVGINGKAFDPKKKINGDITITDVSAREVKVTLKVSNLETICPNWRNLFVERKQNYYNSKIEPTLHLDLATDVTILSFIIRPGQFLEINNMKFYNS